MLRDAAEVGRWDEEVDVVVVGLGAAGAAAAVEASRAGADTLVLERGSAGGGTSAMSGGVLYLGGGTPLQRACGFEDTPEAMCAYLLASCGEQPDVAKTRLYCERSVEHYEWLVENGVPFKATYYPGVSGEPPTDDGLVWSGSERAHPFVDQAEPAPRGHVPRMEHQAGPMLMQRLCAAVEVSPARIAADHPCTALVQTVDGIVVGVVATHFGAERLVRARCGVVLAAGGFINNREMMEEHLPEARRCKIRVGAEGDDGSGIRLGMAAGGATLHMDAASISLPATQPWGLKRGILVNARGERFINEDVYYGRLGEYALYRAHGQAWLIVDDEVFEKPDYPREVAAVGDTPAEVARGLGISELDLEHTLEAYNRAASDGQDPDFHKAAAYLKPLDRAPFGAFDCTTENSIYAAFTLGGLATDLDGRVLDSSGSPIAGLYAVGRSTSGLAVGGYSSGLSLGDGTFFGRRAGQAAAAAGS